MERIDLESLPQGTPQGWYPDPRTPRLIRLWDGESWTDVCYPAPVKGEDGRMRNYHPLSEGERPSKGRTVGVFVMWCLPAVATVMLAPWLEEALWDGRTIGVAPAVILLLAYFAALARRVDYRWFDAAFLFVPIYGLVWAVVITWRNAKLPYRDWSPRPELMLEEAASTTSAAWAVLPGSTRSGVVEGDAERP